LKSKPDFCLAQSRKDAKKELTIQGFVFLCALGGFARDAFDFYSLLHSFESVLVPALWQQQATSLRENVFPWRNHVVWLLN
jgi:uncharacterized integral membrane protein